MEKKCEGCKIAENYKYWFEFPAVKHQFFKVMLGDFKHQLKIPRKFMECFKVKLLPWCTLIGPSKNKWKIRLSSTGDETSLKFSDGWEQFVSDNGVEEADSLVFRFVKDSSFEVTVFDMSGCEREGCHFSINSNSSSRRTSCRSTLHISHGSVAKEEVEICDSSSEDCSLWDEGEEETKDVSHVMEEEREGSSSEGKLPQSQKYFISNRRDLKPGEKKRASKMAECYRRSMKDNKRVFPVFQITMLPTHVYRGFNLTIPKNWAKKHMIKEPHEVELHVPGSIKGSWRVGCRWTKGGSIQCQLRSKWPLFVLENNLEEHDTCVFELIQKGKLDNVRTPIFNVHIFRTFDHIVPLTVSTHMV
ncbi:B3 domain-containing protein REM16-like isoform X1 [Chenopodium quinoa]|uniref:B3 domain-containing protein REM16-like isoform X1 n=2 Tax=Chenopodium quinoa TaxID=63459 RepID=UPI000B77FD3B|nr:B3 domain-containing protein REM16-like isoform X1 [Chenopodium quinoa]